MYCAALLPSVYELSSPFQCRVRAPEECGIEKMWNETRTNNEWARCCVTSSRMRARKCQDNSQQCRRTSAASREEIEFFINFTSLRVVCARERGEGERGNVLMPFPDAWQLKDGNVDRWLIKNSKLCDVLNEVYISNLLFHIFLSRNFSPSSSSSLLHSTVS